MTRLTFATLLLSLNMSSWASLPELNIDIKHTTVSGLSSGGYMATQLHYAHSEWITGAGIIAAGPYLCADGDIKLALSRCVNSAGDGVPLDELHKVISEGQKEGKLAPDAAFEGDKVWLFNGNKDNKVIADVNNLLSTQYQSLLSAEAVRYIQDKPFGHHFPTLQNGSACGESQSPFLGNCNYDAAGKMLNFLHDNLAPRSANPTGVTQQFNQQEVAGSSADSLAELGYAYIPQSCMDGEPCKLHISLHGCNQNAQAVELAYVQNTGLNNWADNNHLVVLYPQTKKSLFMPLNPQACWDWWGYTGEDYANKAGAQIEAVKRMAFALAGNSKEAL